jgi:hypothetical protein
VDFAAAGAVVCAATREQGAGHDVTCARSPASHDRKVRPMSRFLAPFSFTVAAAWVVVLFVLAHNGS